MDPASPNQSSNDKDGDALVSVMDTNPSLGLKTKFLKIPLFIYFIAIFVLIGGYAILRSHADATISTHVWNTTAGWQAGTLDDTLASNNVVTLATHSQRVSHFRKWITTYDSSGSITLDFNAGAKVSWNSLTPVSATPKYTSLSYEERTSSNNSTWSAWTSNVSSAAASQYLQIRANLSTQSTSVTPTLKQLTLVYATTVPAPTVTLTANPTSITSGESSTLSWSSANATSCTASGAWSGSEPTSGSVGTAALTANSTYDISCTSLNQNAATASATVTVTTPPPPTTTTGSGSSATSGCTYNGTAAPCIGSATTGASGWGTPIFDDEFTGTSLDTSKWSEGWFSSSPTAISGPVNTLEVDCYDPAQVAVNNGELDLTLTQKSETCTGESRPYATGLITTDGKFSYTYGFAEARIWVPGNGSIADWPSFWQDGQSWPNDGELDVLEGLGGQACGHWHGPSGGIGIGWNDGSGCSSATYTGGWHTFAADWTANSITWYYDGQDMGSVTAAQASASGNSLVGEPQYLILGLGAAGSGTVASPATQRVDYVRVWQQ